MNCRVLALVFTLVLIAVPTAVADPGDDPVGDLLGNKDKDPAPAPTSTLAETKESVLADEPEATGGLIGNLLSGASDLVKGVGGAIADGVVGSVTAIGAFIGQVLGIAWDGTTWLAATVADGTATAILWSVTGVWSIMTGVVGGTFRVVAATAGGLWTGLESAALGIAGLRPDGMSQGAWAGTVAVAATGASAAANFGLLEALRRFGWAGAGLPLFSRIAKDDILEHPLRAEIFETIKTNPGIHISALARQVDAGWGTTIHHLRKLQEKELVAVRVVNNQKCFFHNGGSIGRNTWAQIPELKNATASKIAHYILTNPLSAVTAISDQLGISPSLVSHHVRKLEGAGVVEKHRDGRFVKLAVTEQARMSLFNEATPVPVESVPGVAA